LIKIKTTHLFGSQERWDLQLVKQELEVDSLDEREALSKGWLFCNSWYPCRSVRIKLDKYKSKPLKYKYYISDYDDQAKALSHTIFQDFLKYKNFNTDYNIFTDLERSKWLFLEEDNRNVTFTKFNMYDGGIESQFTAWNYHKPKLSLGKVIVDYEVEFARNMGFDYLYIGQGYENGSKYKSSFKGFEWWTGSEWSTDKELYEQYCDRDSKINSLNDLEELFNG